MKIRWLGHAAFAITNKAGNVLVFDPFEPNCYGGSLAYPPINVSADVVLASHEHADHYHPGAVGGNPVLISRSGTHEAAGFKIKGIDTFHDPSGGSERGKNIVFVVEADNLRIAHLGDLGHELSPAQISELGRIDVLLIPVGGYFTIEPPVATKVMQLIAPRVVIPMHYKTDAVNFPIAPVEKFTAGKSNVKQVGTNEVTIAQETLPAEREIWILNYR